MFPANSSKRSKSIIPCPRAYQTAIADINGDGKPDIAALGEGKNSRVSWYENPSWKQRPISGNETTDHIDFAFYDLDEDGELELALASDFNLNNSTEGGTISWLDPQTDLDQPWTVYPIASEPTAHRVRWVDLIGRTRKKLIVAPVVGVNSKRPEFDQTPVRLLVYEIPANPKTDTWKRES